MRPLSPTEVLRKLGKGATVGDLHNWRAMRLMALQAQIFVIHQANAQRARRQARPS